MVFDFFKLYSVSNRNLILSCCNLKYSLNKSYNIVPGTSTRLNLKLSLSVGASILVNTSNKLLTIYPRK